MTRFIVDLQNHGLSGFGAVRAHDLDADAAGKPQPARWGVVSRPRPSARVGVGDRIDEEPNRREGGRLPGGEGPEEKAHAAFRFRGQLQPPAFGRAQRVEPADRRADRAAAERLSKCDRGIP